MRMILLILMLFYCLVGISSPDEVRKAQAQLDRGLVLLDSLAPVAERVEAARINFIRRKLGSVKTAIETNGLAHAGTMRSYQDLIVAFKYSNSFLKQMESDSTKEALRELKLLSEEIREDRGFDDTPYTQITASVFSEMYQRVNQLKSLANLPEDLVSELDRLVPELGNVIALAKQGDRPRTFDAAIPVSRKITALYSQLDRIQQSNPAFDVVLDLQGLNEFYAEYAQIEGVHQSSLD